MSLTVLGKIPLVPAISQGGDQGIPITVRDSKDGDETREVIKKVARAVWDSVAGDRIQ